MILRPSRRSISLLRVAALSLVLFSFMTKAAAMDDDGNDSSDLSSYKQYESPRNFMWEIKFGPFRPDIDSEFNGAATPYKDIFGDGRSLLIQSEIDWLFFKLFGELGIGGSVGYFNTSANTFVDTSTDSTTPASTAARSAGETSLRLIPLAALAVYRLDVLAQHFNFPLVPFVKFGVSYTLWSIDKSDGNAASFNGKEASGGTFGWQLNGGVALLLDVLEPAAAKNMDIDTGINHSYLFFEWAYNKAEGLGQTNKLHVGDSSWYAGLAFEF